VDVQAGIDAPQMAVDRSSGEAQDPADLPREIAFAPKELRVAQDLSERLGYATVAARTRSRPSGLATGRRSLSESDQRRALMLPQELIQMPQDRLIVLKAGVPPVRGRKIRYHRERAFRARVLPPPQLATRALPAATPSPAPRPASPTDPALPLDQVADTLASNGLEPLPPQDAGDAAVEAWVDRFLDATEPRIPETGHVR
jgi:type IV secretion system protein VirD4